MSWRERWRRAPSAIRCPPHRDRRRGREKAQTLASRCSDPRPMTSIWRPQRDQGRERGQEDDLQRPFRAPLKETIAWKWPFILSRVGREEAFFNFRDNQATDWLTTHSVCFSLSQGRKQSKAWKVCQSKWHTYEQRATDTLKMSRKNSFHFTSVGLNTLGWSYKWMFVAMYVINN